MVNIREPLLQTHPLVPICIRVHLDTFPAIRQTGSESLIRGRAFSPARRFTKSSVNQVEVSGLDETISVAVIELEEPGKLPSLQCAKHDFGLPRAMHP